MRLIRVPSATTLLDLAGAACLAGFAAFVWPPAALLVLGLAALATSWTRR